MSAVLQDLQYIAPMLLVVGMGLTLMLVDVFAGAGKKDYLGWISLVGIAVALGITAAYWGEPGKPVSRLLFDGMLVVDNYALFMDVLFLICAALTILLSMHYLRHQEMEHGEYYVLILFAVAGMMVLAHAADLVTLFLGIETMSIPVYVLVGWRRGSERSTEGSLKYFLLGAFSTGILLYGIALIYGATGTTSFQEILKLLEGNKALLDNSYLVVGVALLLVALGFKIAAVPMHMWTPDAYEGAPTSVTGFMACAVKAAAFAALIRVFTTVFAHKGLALGPHGWFTLVAVASVLTMTVGNLVAIAQKSVKRMLAYSSIAHAGYLLLGLLATVEIGAGAASSVLFYLLAYSFTVLGAFGIVLLFERQGNDEPLKLDDFAGLGYRHPLAGLALTLFLLSLTGVPPTAGFFAKFYLFRAGIQAGAADATVMYTLVVLALLNSAAAAYYYLRVVVYMYFHEPEGEATPILRSPAAIAALVIAFVAVLLLGILPDPYLGMGEKAMASVGLFAKL
jgi:NADH-quinone oxidoreductase subunit N